MATFEESVRLTLHVLAATLWVGGQFTLLALLPVLRSGEPGLPARAARAFNKVAWPAFGVLVVTGVWNIAAVSGDYTDAQTLVLVLKLVAVATSGLTAYLHAQAGSRVRLAVYGALAGVSAIAAVVLGVVLAG